MMPQMILLYRKKSSISVKHLKRPVECNTGIYRVAFYDFLTHLLLFCALSHEPARSTAGFQKFVLHQVDTMPSRKSVGS